MQQKKMVEKKVVKWKTREALGFLVEMQHTRKFVVPFDYKRPLLVFSCQKVLGLCIRFHANNVSPQNLFLKIFCGFYFLCIHMTVTPSENIGNSPDNLAFVYSGEILSSILKFYLESIVS